MTVDKCQKSTYIHSLKVTFSVCSYLSFNGGISQVNSARQTKDLAKCCGEREFDLTSFFQPGLGPKPVFLTGLFATRKANSQRFLRLPSSEARGLLPPTRPPTH